YAQANKNVVALSAISEMTWKEYANKMQEASEAAANDMEMMPKEEKGATSSEESIDNIEAKVKLVDADYFKIYHKELVAGRVFSPYEQTHAMPVALIKESSVSMFGIGQALGKEIRVNGQPVKIIGVLKDSNESDPSSANYVNSLYMLNTYQQQYGESKDYTYQFHMKLRKGVNKNNEISALKSEANKFVKADQLYVDTYIDNADSTNQMMDMLSFAFMGIALLSLFIGGVGIMNIMLVSVNERIKEIGIRCALGAHKVHIILQFLIEAIMITFIAGIIGIAFAYAGLAIANSQMSDLYLQVDLLKAIGVVGICSSIGIVFGYYPANKAANLKIADALRSE
ncbi:MAG: FtsX-like permease family protein, partial [Erysipelotrichia bacterium]|nr:FtsX-like permease family protein [Erysipelotrichia bacterium]